MDPYPEQIEALFTFSERDDKEMFGEANQASMRTASNLIITFREAL